MRNLSITITVKWYQDFYENPTEANEKLAREEFKKLSTGDIENIELWKEITSVSLAEIEKKLDLLNVHATYNIGESFYE